MQEKNGLEEVESKLKPFKNILVENVKDLKINEKLKELLKYINKLEYYYLLETWPIPTFPITGEYLASKNIPKGKYIYKFLKLLNQNFFCCFVFITKGPVYSKILGSLKNIWINEYNFDCEADTINKLLIKTDELLSNK